MLFMRALIDWSLKLMFEEVSNSCISFNCLD